MICCEERKMYNREHYLKNKATLDKYSKEYNLKNKERLIKYRKEYHAKKRLERNEKKYNTKVI